MKQSLFIAAGQDGIRTVSTDGQTWSAPLLGKEGEYYRAVAFCNGVAVAAGSFGGDNLLATTRDGKAWKTGSQKAGYVNYIRGLGTIPGQFVALGGDPGSVGSSRAFAMLSANGLEWSEPKPAGGKHLLRRFAYGDGRLVAVGDRGRRATSKDAVSWTDAPEAKAIDTLIDVAFGGGCFVGVGLHGLRMRSVDGLSWTDHQAGEEGEHLNTIVWAKDRFVTVGPGATFFSADGKSWERAANENAPQSFAYGAGHFVGVAWKGKILHSADAKTWKRVFNAERNLEAVAFGEIATES